jgi:hypothetical protein
MSNSHSCIVEVDGEVDQLSTFYGALILAGGDLRKMLSPRPEVALDNDFILSSPGQLPITVAFESYGPLPFELVRDASLLFPTLVFALLYLDECSCHVGFVLYRNGTFLDSAMNNDVFRAAGSEHEDYMAGALHPDAATIDGHEAVAWALRLSEALNVVPRDAAIEAGFGDDLQKLESFAERVEELGPEYEHVTTPLSSSRRFLGELCEQASILEARFTCRMAVRKALGDSATLANARDLNTPIRRPRSTKENDL